MVEFLFNPLRVLIGATNGWHEITDMSDNA